MICCMVKNDFIKNRVIYRNLVNVRFDKLDDEDI